MTTEKWVRAYTRNGNHSNQYSFKSGGWCCFSRGVYDGRGIMSDCVKPSWESSGEFMIEIIPEGKHHNSDADFWVYADKDWMNRIVYTLQQGGFQSVEAFKEALRKVGKEQDTYNKVCGHESVRLFSANK